MAVANKRIKGGQHRLPTIDLRNNLLKLRITPAMTSVKYVTGVPEQPVKHLYWIFEPTDSNERTDTELSPSGTTISTLLL